MNKREDKKEHILEAGLEIMFLRGYNGTGVKEIVEAAGIPKGSFYNYFDSKESFAIEALECACVQSCEEIQKALAHSSLPPLERLHRFYQDAAKNMKANDYLHGCLIGNLCQEMSNVNEPVRTKVKTLMDRVIAHFENCLKEAQGRGELSAERDAKVLAEFIFNAWQGSIMRSKGSKNDFAFNSFLSVLSELLK